MMTSSSLNKPQEATAAAQLVPHGRRSNVSRNFSFAKVVAILTVATGHWFTGTILWIPVTFGLLVFGFSSGYFTSAMYGPRVNHRHFWRKKIERLGLRYWVVLGFIMIVSDIPGRSVWHWHSLVHLVGLSGVLNWIRIPNQSTLGSGLWFFTLLLLFYISYPYLAKLARSRHGAAAILVGGFILAVFLEENIKVGHELWLTAYAFAAGVAWGAHRTRLSATTALIFTASSWSILLAMNLLGIKAFNTILLAAGGLWLSCWLTVAKVPQWAVIDRVAVLDRYVLEIFLVHTYLFIHPTGRNSVDFMLSIGLIIIVAVILGKLADFLSARVFRERSTDRVVKEVPAQGEGSRVACVSASNSGGHSAADQS